MRWGVVMALLEVLACSSGTGPGARIVPPLGTYTYTFTHPPDADGVIAGRTFSGTLVLRYASSDSIAGQWTVPGYAPVPLYGGLTEGIAYHLGARIVDGTAADSLVFADHSLFWHPDRVVCGASRTGIVGSHIVLVVGTCTLAVPSPAGPPPAP